MESKEFTVVVEKDAEGWYVVTAPGIPGCYTQGKTLEEALARIKEAIEVCLESDDHIIPLTFVGIQRIHIKV